MIGLSNERIQEHVVQLNVHYAAEKRYVHIKNLQCALISDPDLNPLSREHTYSIVQCLFVTRFTKTIPNGTRTEIQFKFKPNINDTLMHYPETSTVWL